MTTPDEGTADTRGMDTVRLTYTGAPSKAGALAKELESRGLTVKYQPPIETKDLATALNAVSLFFSVTGNIQNVVLGVRAFKARFPGTQVEGLPKDEGLSIQERLGRLDELKADGTITAEEHSEQRARILGEL
jgi:hypothetical protein